MLLCRGQQPRIIPSWTEGGGGSRVQRAFILLKLLADPYECSKKDRGVLDGCLNPSPHPLAINMGLHPCITADGGRCTLREQRHSSCTARWSIQKNPALRAAPQIDDSLTQHGGKSLDAAWHRPNYLRKHNIRRSRSGQPICLDQLAVFIKANVKTFHRNPSVARDRLPGHKSHAFRWVR